MGMRKVSVNSDSKTVVDFVNDDEAPTNDPLIRGIRDLLDSDEWEVTLSWIPRAENGE
ncbi:hypothetical protein A2U01_0106828, partial [Trifolium medium]|nr:hypothetical protein [Trifolium medium]